MCMKSNGIRSCFGIEDNIYIQLKGIRHEQIIIGISSGAVDGFDGM